MTLLSPAHQPARPKPVGPMRVTMARTGPARATRRKASQLLRASARAEQEYVRQLQRIMRGIHEGIVGFAERHVIPHVAGEHHDAAVPPISGRIVVPLLVHTRRTVGAAFDTMKNTVSKKNAAGLALFGIEPRHVPGMDGMLEHARQRSIDLLSRAGQDFAEDVDSILSDPDNFGLTVAELSGLIEERTDVSENRAVTIARTETLRTSSIINQMRQEHAGVDEYLWSTSQDERVAGNPGGKYPKALPSHWDREGQRFSWADPPTEDEDDGPPGQNRPNCRCVSLPFISEAQEDEPDDEEAGDEPEDIAAEE